MKLNKIDHIGIRVSDFDKAIHFYKKIGFSVVRKDLKERVVEVKHACGITVNFLDSANSDKQRKNVLMDITEKYPGYTHYAIHVDSIVDAVEYLKSNAINTTEGPVTFGNGKTSIFIRDPDLNVIEFTQ